MRLLVLLGLFFAHAAGLGGGAVLTQEERSQPNSGAVRQDSESANGNKIDPELLDKIRPLYPHILLERVQPGPEESGKPFFALVKQMARVRVPDGKERLVVEVGWTIPGPYVDRGGGELLFYENAEDELPLLRESTFSLGPGQGRLINNRWLQFGNVELLLSLTDKEALKRFERHGYNVLIFGLARDAARLALEVYLEQGREAFLKVAPVMGDHSLRAAPIRGDPEWRVIELPERISRYEFYPALVEEMQRSGFKYFDSWEATVLARLTPAGALQKPLILELGACGLTAGIEAHDVELLVWAARSEEPTDRPGPGELSRLSPSP